MITRRSFVTSCLAGLPVITPISAISGSPQPVVLKSAHQIDKPPYTFLDKEGTGKAMRGVLIDLLNMLEGPCESSFLHHGYPWARAQTMVATGAADVFCCQITEQRLFYARFAPTPIAHLAPPRIYFAKDNPNAEAICAARSAEDFHRFTTADLLGDSRAEEIWKAHPHRTQVSETETILSMLLSKHADFVLADPLTMQFKIKELGLANKLSSIDADHLCSEHHKQLHFGLRKTIPNAQTILAAVDNKIRSHLNTKLQQQITSRYLPATSSRG